MAELGEGMTKIGDSLCKFGKASFSLPTHVSLVPLGLCPSASTSNDPAQVSWTAFTEGLGPNFCHVCDQIEGQTPHRRHIYAEPWFHLLPSWQAAMTCQKAARHRRCSYTAIRDPS